MRVLVTDSNTRTALAVTRSLGRQGHNVIVAGDTHPSLASVSRYSSSFRACPSPILDAESFTQAILQTVVRDQIELLLPITEVTTLLLSEVQHLLPPSCTFPFPAAECVSRAANKAIVIDLAKAAGVPVPYTRVITTAADVPAALEGLQYPVVIKPARSRVRTDSGWISTSVSYADSPDSLIRQLSSIPRTVFPILLQERVIGPGVGVFACYEYGRQIGLFAHRRLREKPPSGGVSVLSESAPLDQDAAHYSDVLLRQLCWKGVAMVEFKRDERDGLLRLMEINGRFWGSLQLAIDSGVDFPRLVADAAQGIVPSRPDGYRIGVQTRWFLGDLDALVAILTRSRQQLNLPKNHPGKIKTLRNFLHLWRKDQRYEVLRPDDPKPGLLETWQWLSSGFERGG